MSSAVIFARVSRVHFLWNKIELLRNFLHFSCSHEQSRMYRSHAGCLLNISCSVVRQSRCFLSKRAPSRIRRMLKPRGETNVAPDAVLAAECDASLDVDVDAGENRTSISSDLRFDDDIGVDALCSRLETAAEGYRQRRVLILQPHLKWSPKQRTVDAKLRCKRLLDEAVSLVHSLPHWQLCGDPIVLNVSSESMFTVFGPGQIQEVVKAAHKMNASDVLFNVSRLTASQCCHLEGLMNGRIVWDRYSMVLAIFKRHAISASARLHVALAELPYLRTRLRATGQYTAERSVAIDNRAKRLRTSLQRYIRHDETSRQLRRSTEVPIVGVVGYTNAGKTSLINALSGSRRAVGRDQVFATLDVTAHRSTVLRQEALLTPGDENDTDVTQQGFSHQFRHVYLDTVGFMLELPSSLLDGFRATLKEVNEAHLILHVVDVSQPDWRRQLSHVEETLQQLGLPRQLLERRLLVGNKCDLLPSSSALLHHAESSRNPLANGEKEDMDGLEEMMIVSAKNGHGMQQLLQEVQLNLLLATDRQLVEVAVPTGSPSYSWLLQNMLVLEQRQLSQPLSAGSTNAQGCQMTLFSVAVSPAELASLRRNCLSLKVAASEDLSS